MESRWYVIRVMSGQEKKVKKTLEENRHVKGMDGLIEEILVPSENVAEVKKGEQRVTEKRLWPGYALVKMRMNDETWMYVKETNGVIDFMGGGVPVPLSDGEVHDILQDLQQKKGAVVHKHKCAVGDRVKIIDGVFVNFIGVIQEVNHERGRLSAMVSIFGRETPVDDLEFWQVEEVTSDTEVE
ncbi:MAG: transcription termination/antitermination protein NusG [Simkaniaceae bacterium]|nr:transcription termination/antitermination protein NusG [Simkaniaceae bacterium]